MRRSPWAGTVDGGQDRARTRVNGCVVLPASSAGGWVSMRLGDSRSCCLTTRTDDAEGRCAKWCVFRIVLKRDVCVGWTPRMPLYPVHDKRGSPEEPPVWDAAQGSRAELHTIAVAGREAERVFLAQSQTGGTGGCVVQWISGCRRWCGCSKTGRQQRRGRAADM